MIGKLNHIAIATPKLDEAVKTYKDRTVRTSGRKEPNRKLSGEE